MAAYEELGYALEKFGQAINDLANRPGKPQDRLTAARLRFRLGSTVCKAPRDSQIESPAKGFEQCPDTPAALPSRLTLSPLLVHFAQTHSTMRDRFSAG
jgi:hypothetical protein